MNKDTFNQVLIAVVVIYVLTKIEKIFSGIGDVITPPDDAIIGGTSDENTVDKKKLSYSENTYKSIADAIEIAVWSGLFGQLSENDEIMFHELSKMKSDNDYFYLSNIYQKRGRGIAIQQYYNLTQTINKYLDKAYKNDLNALYASRGMSISFA